MVLHQDLLDKRITKYSEGMDKSKNCLSAQTIHKQTQQARFSQETAHGNYLLHFSC